MFMMCVAMYKSTYLEYIKMTYFKTKNNCKDMAKKKQHITFSYFKRLPCCDLVYNITLIYTSGSNNPFFYFPWQQLWL